MFADYLGDFKIVALPCKNLKSFAPAAKNPEGLLPHVITPIRRHVHVAQDWLVTVIWVDSSQGLQAEDRYYAVGCSYAEALLRIQDAIADARGPRPEHIIVVEVTIVRAGINTGRLAVSEATEGATCVVPCSCSDEFESGLNSQDEEA